MTTITQTLCLIFLLVFLGLACQKRKVFNPTHIEAFEIFLFKIGLPSYLFTATLHYDLKSLLNWPFIYSYLSIFLVIATFTFLYFWRKNSPSSLCVKILASGYVNSAVYSLPIVTLLLKDPRAVILANLIQVVVIQSFFITLLGLLSPTGQAIHQKLLRSLTTPLVAMPILGLALNYCHLMPHPVILAATKTIGECTAALSLFSFGLSLGGVKIYREALNKELGFILLTKNLLHPLLAYLVGSYIFHLENYWLYALVITASAPTAYVIYILAKQFSIDQALVRLIVALSSISSLFSLAFIIWAL